MGTHPIFESDFDCLTDMNNLRKKAHFAVNKMRPKNKPFYEPRAEGRNVVNDATLGSGNLRMAVMLAEAEDENEWIACNIAEFYKQISMLYVWYGVVPLHEPIVSSHERWPKLYLQLARGSR